jgi:hypothetical protein
MQSSQGKSPALPDTINTLWFGNHLGYLERLSIASFLANGHKVNVFSYQPEILHGVPEGVDLRNAREVMDDPKRVRLFDGKLKALGSDFFRYEVFAKNLGYWADLDVILLKRLCVWLGKRWHIDKRRHSEASTRSISGCSSFHSRKELVSSFLWPTPASCILYKAIIRRCRTRGPAVGCRRTSDDYLSRKEIWAPRQCTAAQNILSCPLRARRGVIRTCQHGGGDDRARDGSHSYVAFASARSGGQ